MRDRNPRPARRRNGFSLIELMVVITIIGLLTSIVGVNVWKHMKRANVESTKTQMKAIEGAVNTFRLAHKRLPETLDELVGEDGDLDSDTVPQDAWGNEFQYEPQGSKDYILVSLGADGVEGGEDEDADIDRESLRRRDDEDR